jgi:nucleotide-binding universal stress UspA family protein
MKDYKTNFLGNVETIMLSTDASSFSDGAVQEAIFFSQACGAKLVVLPAIEIKTESATVARSGIIDARNEAKDHLAEIEKIANDSAIDCSIIIEESYQIDKCIFDEAIKCKADVIIMGRHGKRGLLKLLVGSMTSRIIGYGFPKVLVVPKDFTISGEKVLIATDGSSFSKMATNEAMSLAKNCSTLKELFVVSAAIKEEDLAKAQQNVDAVLTEAKKQNINAPCTSITAVAKPSTLICQTAKENNVDMILIGGFGDAGLMKTIMGHVTEDVVGNAHCAVLVVEE